MTCFYSKEFSVKAFTDVENAFIQEFMPISDGDAVKVYLYGLFLCKNTQYDQSLSDIAKTLSLSEQDVITYFKYWEEFGIVSVISTDPLSVQYLPVKNSGNNKPRKYKVEKYSEFTKGLQPLFASRMISTSEYTEYFNIMETYGIKPEAMLMIIKYCVDKKGGDIGQKYISKVTKDFGNRGIVTVEKVEKELSSYLYKTAELERILKALSLKRSPDIEDLNLYKKWTSDLNFESDNIIFAASKIKKGGMEKLDAFLMELYSTKSFSKQEISEYINRKQSVYDLAIKINKALSIYVDVLDTVIDTYTNKWISYGFTDETLLYVASHCFKTGKNTLQDMNELIENLRNRGFIDLTSVSDHFESLRKTDEFISGLLSVAGVSRRPTPWDRENVSMWMSWNFSQEMIMEAARLSAGKSSPIAYMNGILSNWKNNGVFTLSGIEKSAETTNVSSQEAYNREYERRRRLAVSRAQRNTDTAMEIEGFPSVYERIFSIEKDLAFAEISNNSELLNNLENEKKLLIVSANDLLKSVKLTLEDLSPKYACEKCKDTGYVGTHRCDCL
ncbi:MAG: DnaD domain protein [Clostridia bacterium]|nr:DnaD domain protein [Clostridia bacterium]